MNALGSPASIPSLPGLERSYLLCQPVDANLSPTWLSTTSWATELDAKWLLADGGPSVPNAQNPSATP